MQEREDRFVIIRFDILQSKDLSPSEKLVYARMCGFRKYFESKEECAEILGVSKNTVIKAKQKLLKLGYIKEIGNTGRGKIYQSVYDEDERVVDSTTQSGRKQPIRVVDSTTIEEIESKDRVKIDTKVSMAKPEQYGKPEINELFEIWQTAMGYKISANITKNRNAANNLIKKHGVDGISRVIRALPLIHAEKFAPVKAKPADFIELQSKWDSVMAYGRSLKENNNATARF